MTTEQTLSPEAAALLADAAALDADTAPPPIDATGQPIAPTDYAAESSILLGALVGIATPFYPCVGTIWTAPKQAAVAAALAPVLEKYGFTMGDFLGAWKAEITLAVVAGPLILETIDGIKADRKKPKPTDTAPAADALTGSAGEAVPQ